MGVENQIRRSKTFELNAGYLLFVIQIDNPVLKQGSILNYRLKLSPNNIGGRIAPSVSCYCRHWTLLHHENSKTIDAYFPKRQHSAFLSLFEMRSICCLKT